MNDLNVLKRSLDLRIAVVGSGVSGLTAAWLLADRHEVTVFEADSRLGGHTHTVNVDFAGRHYGRSTPALLSTTNATIPISHDCLLGSALPHSPAK